MARVYELKPTPDTLHGFFSRDIEPALQTLDSAWGIEKRSALGAPRKRFLDTKPHRQSKTFGHALIGPVYINGAMPGSTLEVKINEIVPGTWGWSSAGGFNSYWNEKMNMVNEQEVVLDFELDHEKMVAISQFSNFDYRVRINPFMGIMGMPPAEPGHHSTFFPLPSGGNIDCKELLAGSTLYLPIPVEGGLFSTGDGHAAQGDGEVSGPALECPMEKVSFTFNVLDNMKINMPRAKTRDGWLTMGFHENLDEAMWIALNEMLDVMTTLYNMSRAEAYAFASLVVDLRITQIVNTFKGVHAFISFDALR